MNHQLLFPVLAVVGALPVFLLVASLSRTDLKSARTKSLKFLQEWGGVAPKSVAEWVKTALGSSVGFALLVALAFTFNLAGDHSMRFISSTFDHFGVEYTQWSSDHEFDWKKVRNNVQRRWVELHPSEDLNNNPEDWSKWKNDRNKWQTRAARTLVYFALLLCLAGIIDLAYARFRRRGLVNLALGIVSFVVLSMIWSDRKAHYVEAVLRANDSLGAKAIELPASCPRKQSDL